MAPFTARGSLAAFTGQCLSVPHRHRPPIGSYCFPAHGRLLKSLDKHTWGARGLRASLASGLRQKISSNAVNFVKRLPSLLAAGTMQLVKLETTVLTPTVLVAIPALLTVWALLEMGYWRLLCQPNKGKAPFPLLRHFAWTCLPIFLLSVGWQTRGQAGVALGFEIMLRLGAAWCLWQWPEQQQAIDEHSSLPLRYSTRIWRRLLSLSSLLALGLRVPLSLSGGAQPLLSTALLPWLPRWLSHPWPPLLLRLWLSVYGLYFLLVYLPHTQILEGHLTPPPEPSRRFKASGRRWWHLARRLNGSRESEEQRLVADLLAGVWPKGGAHEVMARLWTLVGPRSEFVNNAGDTWRRARREEWEDRRKAEERERKKQATMLALRRRALRRTLEGGERERKGKVYLTIRWKGPGEREEREREGEDRERSASLVKLVQKVTEVMKKVKGKAGAEWPVKGEGGKDGKVSSQQAADRAKAEQLEVHQKSLALVKDIMVLLGREAEVEDLPWLDYVATHASGDVLRHLLVRYWIEAETFAARQAETDKETLGRDVLAKLMFGGPSSGGGDKPEKAENTEKARAGLDLPAGLAYGGTSLGAVWDFERTFLDDDDGEEEEENEDEEEGADDAEGELFRGLFRQARRGEGVVVRLEDGVVVRMSGDDVAKAEELGREDEALDAEYPCPADLRGEGEEGVRKWRRYVRRWLRWQGKHKGRENLLESIITLGGRSGEEEDKAEREEASSSTGEKKNVRTFVRPKLSPTPLTPVAPEGLSASSLPVAPSNITKANSTAAGGKSEPNSSKRRQYLQLYLRGLVKTRLFDDMLAERQADISERDIPREYLAMKTERVVREALSARPVGVTGLEALELMLGGPTPAAVNVSGLRHEVEARVEWGGEEEGLYKFFRRGPKRREVDGAYREGLRGVAADVLPEYLEWLRKEEMEGRDFMYEYREAKGNKWRRTWKPQEDEEEEEGEEDGDDEEEEEGEEEEEEEEEEEV